MTYRKYRTTRGAQAYVSKLNAQLSDMNAKRVDAGKGLSGVDFYMVGNDPQGFGYVALACLTNGKNYVCA